MKKAFCLVLLTAALLSGCNQQTVSNNESFSSSTIDSGAETEPVGHQTNESWSIPSEYSRSSESGKVAFQLSPEYPATISARTCIVPEVKGKLYADPDKLYTMFVNGKEIKETHFVEGHNAPDETYYILTDNTFVGTGGEINYSNGNARYYSNVDYKEDYNLSEFSDSELPFASKEDSIDEVKASLSEVGISPDLFSFSAVALDHETLEKLESECADAGEIDTDDMKAEWSQADDAYFVYGYQVENGITIFNENMSINRLFADYSPANSTIAALLSANGLIGLQTNCIYDLSWDEGREAELKPFEEIADVVEEKYDMILNDANYIVNRAYFAVEISLNEKQEYAATPIWYFEVIENDETRSYVWVNAITGDEIFF